MSNKIPSDRDWGDYKSNLDLHFAYKLFAGKSNQEMLIEFKKNVTERSNDFLYMPKVPFQYYIFGFKNYIDKEDFPDGEQDEAVAYFLDTVIFAIKNHPEYILPIMDKLMSTIEYIADNQAKFDADIEIYGDFKRKLNSIKKSLGD